MMKLRGKKKLMCLLVLVMMITVAGCSASNPKPYDYDLDEYVSVGEYTGLTYDSYEVEVTADELEAALQEALSGYAQKTVINEGIVEYGDYISILYLVEMNGESMGASDDQSMVVKAGDSGLLSDIDTALIGSTVGDTVVVNTRYPDDYDVNPELAGMPVTFRITIQNIVELVYPELTDEFAAEHLGVETAGKYMEILEQSLLENEEAEARYAAGEALWNQVLESSEAIRYPEDEVQTAVENLNQNILTMCEEAGITMEEVLRDQLQMDQETYDAKILESARQGVMEEMVLYSIARENNLELSEAEIETYLESMLQTNGMTGEEFEEQYGVEIREYAEKSGILISLLYERVFGFLVEKGIAG